MVYWLLALVFSVGFNVALFIPAFIYKTDKLTDLSYSLTFIFLVVLGFAISNKKPLDILLLVLVSAWAVRLGGFLFMRIQKMKRDKRFDDKRDDFGKFLAFWLLQGVTVAVVMTASLLAFKSDSTKDIGGLALTGVIIFAFGLVLEATADAQKYKFSQTNKARKWIDTGVWRISRHPNYLGEMLVWIGVYIVTYDALTSSGRLFALVSPAFIIILLLFVSGIPLLEKSADKKWGGDKDYIGYKKSVPILIPTPSSIRRITKG